VRSREKDVRKCAIGGVCVRALVRPYAMAVSVQDRDTKWHIISRDETRKAWQARIHHGLRNTNGRCSLWGVIQGHPSADEQLLMDGTGSGWADMKKKWEPRWLMKDAYVPAPPASKWSGQSHLVHPGAEQPEQLIDMIDSLMQVKMWHSETYATRQLPPCLLYRL